MAAKRQRWTKEELERLDDLLIQALAVEPATARNVFYQLAQAGELEKTDAAYDRVLRRLKDLRFAGRVPWDAVIDRGRRPANYYGYEHLSEWLTDVVGAYSSDVWLETPYVVQIWCEGDGLEPVLSPVARAWSTDIYPAKGFSSHTFIRSAALTIHNRYAVARNKKILYGRGVEKEKAIILYIGDYDPAGVLIPESIQEGLRYHLDDFGDKSLPLDWRRVALNEDQIAFYNLMPKPVKSGERRRPDIQGAWEAEAFEQSALRELLTDALGAIMGPDWAAEVKVGDADVQEALRGMGGPLDALGVDLALETLEEAVEE